MPSTRSTPTGPKILILDDHQAILKGTVDGLKAAYPDANLQTALTAEAVTQKLVKALPDVLIMDLSIPEDQDGTPTIETGIQLLYYIFQNFQELNIVVQSANVKALVRIKDLIDAHMGGFTVVDKNLSLQDMLIRVDWALKGVVFTPPAMRNGLEMRLEWLEVLKLAYEEALTDRAIAERMHVAERTVRNYWTNAQDVLGVYPEPGRNIRLQTAIRAREEGLID
jgi:DNA-binding NarL/FixJ family response regulator